MCTDLDLNFEELSKSSENRLRVAPHLKLEGIEMMCGKCHAFLNLCTIVLLSALLRG